MIDNAATQLMPDFTAPAAVEMLSALQDRHIDLGTSFLTSLTALTLGMGCVFFRPNHEVSPLSASAKKENPYPTLYRVISGKGSEVFHGSVSLEKLNKSAAILTKNKVATRQKLAAAGIRTPFGGGAWSDNMEAIDAISNAGVKRVLVKPFSGSLGRGIKANITIEEARQHIEAHPDEKFVVEQFITGREFRIFTVGGEYSQCFARLPDHIVGNGRNTIDELLSAKMIAQMNNPATRTQAKRNLDKGKFLVKSGFDLASIPSKGQFIQLNDSFIPLTLDGAFIPTGVSNEVKKLARDVAKCVGADTVAMDLIDRGSEGSYVLEVNAKANMFPICFPTNAKWNLQYPEAVLRNSFPDHKDKPRQVKSYNYLQLIKDYRSQLGVMEFNSEDYVEFA